MTRVEPKVFFVAESLLPYNTAAVEWLRHMGVQDPTAHVDPNGDNDGQEIVALAARRCYKSYEVGLNPNVKKVRSELPEYLENVIASGHGSVLEHSTATYAFEDVSRVFTHEMVRHRAGTAFSQESLRYVRLHDLRVWIPDIIEKEKERRVLGLGYEKPGARNEVFSGTPEEIFEHVFATCEWAQRALAEYFKIDEMKDFGAKKRLTSAFRRVAPIGLATGIVVTFNMRSLRWVIEQRTAPGAEEEMRLVFGKVFEDAVIRWPHFFSDFQTVVDEHGAWHKPGHSKV